MFAVIFTIIFVFLTYTTYCYNYNILISGSNDEFSIELLMSGLNYIGEKIPFIGKLLIQSLQMQITQLWWIHLMIIGILVVTSSSNNNPYNQIEHGSSRLATEEEKKSFAKDTTGIPCGKDFYVPLSGKIGKRRVAANLNEIVIGGSGAGKSLRKAQPDIMQMWGSYVVTDPKGELFRNCYQMLKDNDYEIRVLNLIDIHLSDSYNPFSYMTSEQDVLEICSLFMSASAGDGEKEDFWVGTALELLTAISIYLFKSDNEVKCFGRVIRLLNSIRYNKSGQIDESCELARCMTRHAIKYPYDAATITWSGLQDIPHETMGSIQKTLSTRLRLWAVEDVDLLTAKDDMEFDLIGDRKTAIFLIIPVPSNPYKAVANIFYSQLFQRMFRIAEDRRHNGSLKYLVSVEMDEFANVGQIPYFEKILAVVRSYNIRVCIILQDLSQLEALYKDTYRGIIANCSIMTFLGTTEDDTLKKLSEKLGNISVETNSKSYNRTGAGGGQDTESRAARPLLTPDEIKDAVKAQGSSIPYDGSCIVWVGYERPFYMYKYDTFNHPLMSVVGGPAGTLQCINNTYIEDIYGDKFEEKKKQHEEFLSQKRSELRKEEEQLQAEEKCAYEENQERLRKQFDEETAKFKNPPLSDKEEEERMDAEFDEEMEFINYNEEIYQTCEEYEADVNPVLRRLQNIRQTVENNEAEEAFADEMSEDDIMPDDILYKEC